MIVKLFEPGSLEHEGAPIRSEPSPRGDWAMSRLIRRSLVALVLAGLVSMTLAPGAMAQRNVNTGFQPFLSYAPFFLAMENGYFKEQGLKITAKRFISAQKMMAPAATGQLDIIGGSLSAGFFNAFLKGVDMRIVTEKGRLSKGGGYLLLLVRKDLYDSGAIRSPKDLVGRTWYNNAPFTSGEYVLSRILEHHGVKYDHSRVKYLSIPKIVAGMKTKAVEVGMSVDPWGARAEAMGVGKILVTGDEIPATRDFSAAFFIYTGKFIRERKADAQAWMNAYVKGVKFYLDTGQKSDAVGAVMNKWTKLPPAIIKKAIHAGFTYKSLPNVPGVMAMQDWLHGMGVIKGKVTAKQLFDLSFVKKATK